MKKTNGTNVKPVGHIYVFAGVWAVVAVSMPVHTLAGIIGAAVIAGLAALFTKPFFAYKLKKKIASQPPQFEHATKPQAEAAKEADKVSYGSEIDAIIEEGKTAQREMGRLYGSIKNQDVRNKINKIMEISDKIVQDAIHDPSDVPQIQRFLSYYLPTTIKLLNAYDRMGNQGVKGENITSSMGRIEDMLDAAIEAYEKQLDSLFANQALDIETEIQVMNSMISREGLGKTDFKF